MHPNPDPSSESSSSEERTRANDPYADLENIFADPIVLDDVDLPPATAPADVAEGSGGEPEQLWGALQGIDEVTRRLWTRIGVLEGEIRSGSERTLEALRRLGERMGSELAMLDKRAVNLELTVARLRSITEAVESATRRLAEQPREAGSTSGRATREAQLTPEHPSPTPASPDPDGPEWEPPREEPGEEETPPQASLPGTQPEPRDWSHPSMGPPPDSEPPDDR